MGRDKAMLLVDGSTVLATIAREAQAAGLRSAVVGRVIDEHVAGVERWIEDDMPGEGPLAALATALRALGDVILVACDMPRLDARAFEWLARQPVDEVACGLVVRNGEVLEPLFAHYRARCLPAIEELLAAGRRSIGALINTGTLAIVDAPHWLREHLVNINTPEDLASIRRTS